MQFSIDNTSLKGYYNDLVGHLGEMSLKLREAHPLVCIKYVMISPQLHYISVLIKINYMLSLYSYLNWAYFLL